MGNHKHAHLVHLMQTNGALATIRRASISKPESVSSIMAILGSSIAICRISARFLLPKPSLNIVAGELLIDAQDIHLLAQQATKFGDWHPLILMIFGLARMGPRSLG